MSMYLDFRRERKSRILHQVVNYVITILVAFVLAFCFVYFFFQTTNVVGDSMSPVLEDGNQVMLSRSSYFIKKPDRYDIVKFQVTKSETEHEYIKRIIGLPKETIQIKDGSVFVDGKQLTDIPFDDLILSPGIAAEEFTLGEEEYFMIGDNCNNSEDSRFTNVGAVSRESIKGKIIARRNGYQFHKIK